ncbi:MAG: RNA 2',3'-cyclic phosphodiesterase [Candidatus Methanoplasma sp.]|jgi:2'-5' RNA ligase|nr:RNA 2',3'-cyclic phosphodiesterase [Candidatus Methanoplasma sp.]
MDRAGVGGGEGGARLFIAVCFGAETTGRLAALRDEIRSASRRGRFAPDGNLHLTLAFLGECGAVEAALAADAMRSIAFEPFYAAIDRIGRFRRADGDLWWAGLREDAPLMSLHRRLSERLRDAGFGAEGRRYSPHVTLGRGVRSDMAPRAVEPFGEAVRSILLMRSDPAEGGRSYSVVRERLAEPPGTGPSLPSYDLTPIKCN